LAKLATFAAQRGFELQSSFEIRWHCVVEEGTLLECNRSFGGLLTTKGYEYDAVSAAGGT
jgi:hypothetical protein